MAELNITFAGICTHFHDVVPGVPMRAVLPNAMGVHMGEIQIPQPGNLPPHIRSYYLMPHVAYVRDKASGGIGTVLEGRYLKVLNAKGNGLIWDRGGFSLAEFIHDFGYSQEVVLGGNAACYFDIFTGKTWTEGKDDEPRITRVRMETDGTPILSISPLPGSLPDPVADGEYPIETYELIVTNLDFDPACEYSSFDFLLNYLVAQGGIPKILAKPTPGMPDVPQKLTAIKLGEKLKALGELVETLGTVAGYRASGGQFGPPIGPGAKSKRSAFGAEKVGSSVQAPVPFDQSCSDSHYP